MKIGFVYSSNGWGGLEMNILKIAKSLTQIGYEIVLISNKESTVYQKGKHLFSSIIEINPKSKYFDFATAKLLAKDLKSADIKRVIVFDNRDIDLIA